MTSTDSRAMSERVADRLRRSILDGEIRPGTRLLQTDVADALGTSRLPVREALRMLAAEGLLELEANKGARVPKLDAAEVTLLYRMRERLEPLAIIESLPRLGAGELERLREIQARISADVELRDFLALDREFHMLTYSGCTSEHLMVLVRRFWNSTQHYRRAFMEVSGAARRWVVDAEHGLIIDALERRDPIDAERFLAGHIRRTRTELLAHSELFH